MAFRQIVDKMILNPRRLFLIDGLGAIVSAVLLGVVLVRFEHLFGMPQKARYFLALFPSFFAGYDIFCYIQIREYRKLVYIEVKTYIQHDHPHYR